MTKKHVKKTYLDRKTTGCYKGGKKHGNWSIYDPKNLKFTKSEYYWNGKLLAEYNSMFEKDEMFDSTDSFIEYHFGLECNYVIDSLLKANKLFSWVKISKDKEHWNLFFYSTNENPIISNLLNLTTRFIVTEKFKIPIIFDYDYIFANLDFALTHSDLIIKINNDKRVIEINGKCP